MTAILKREVRSSFHGMIGYVLTAFMLAATAIYFVALNLGYGLTDFGYYTLYRTTFVLLLYIPVLTMRSFAEERRTRTDQLLLTSPVSVWEIVLGKFFALCVIFALPCLADAVMILVLAALGATGTATLANLAALLCYYLMGCAAIAIGVFLSSLTENQIIAAVAGVSRTAAGLYDAQPAQHVHRRQRSGAGPVHRHCSSAQCGGRPAYPQLYAGLPDLCGLLCGADGTVPAAEQLADRSVQRGAQRAVPVHAV
jgi:hypothetical protein